MADQPSLDLLKRMKQKGDLDNAVLLFLSDHGLRLGSYPKTFEGSLENNLPFLFIKFPDWFHAEFPELVANVGVNARRLVTPFDIGKTLKHLLHLQTNSTQWRNDLDGGDATVFQTRIEFEFKKHICTENTENTEYTSKIGQKCSTDQ